MLVIQGTRYVYKGKTYRVVKYDPFTYAQDKDTGNWGPSVRYHAMSSDVPVHTYFVRNAEEFQRKFKEVKR